MRRSDREIKDLKEIMNVIQQCDTCRAGLMEKFLILYRSVLESGKKTAELRCISTVPPREERFA